MYAWVYSTEKLFIVHSNSNNFMCQHYLSMKPVVILEVDFESYVDWLNANHERFKFMISYSPSIIVE